jgi:hypothetical protein
VNPAHLFLATNWGNHADMSRKGRNGRKIDQETARKIKDATEGQRRIAKRFGVSQRLVQKIQKGKLWKYA